MKNLLIGLLVVIPVFAQAEMVVCKGVKYSGGPVDNPEKLKVEIKLNRSEKRYNNSEVKITVPREKPIGKLIARETCTAYGRMDEDDRCADGVDESPAFTGLHLVYYPPSGTPAAQVNRQNFSLRIFRDLSGEMNYRFMTYRMECTLVEH